MLDPRFRRVRNGRDMSKLVHSSGYARTAYGERLGATTSQRFGQRINIDRARQVVGRYRQSQMGSQLSHSGINSTPRNKASDASKSFGSNIPPEQRSEYKAGGVKPQPKQLRPDASSNRQLPPNSPQRQSFNEPPSRGYNPYA